MEYSYENDVRAITVGSIRLLTLRGLEWHITLALIRWPPLQPQKISQAEKTNGYNFLRRTTDRLQTELNELKLMS